MKRLNTLFNPKTIAVIGATSKPGHVGYGIMKNLVGSGYDGVVYPINPQRDSVLGVKAFPSVDKVPDKIDVAIIATPARTVADILEECGRSGVPAVVIISSGFKEAGKEGEALYAQIAAIISKYDMRALGPNCLGFLRPPLHLNASFSAATALPGGIAFISQSGALGTAILDWALKQNVGLNYFVSLGSMIDIGFHDLIDYFGEDPTTTSIIIYMETLTQARKFLSAARAFARTKPIIVLKVGRSSEGARAARSHTGSLTGNDAVFDAAFKRAGILRVNTIGEMFDCAQTLAMQKRPKGSRLAIVTNAGGPGVIATDYLVSRGGVPARLSDETLQKLNAILPPAWSRGNPVDILGDAGVEHYRQAMELCLADPGVDGLLVILTPQVMTDPSAVAQAVVDLAGRAGKTVLASWMGEAAVEAGREILKKGRVPVYAIPENAVRSFMNMVQYARNLELLYETPGTIPSQFTPQTEDNRRLLSELAGRGRFTLTGVEANQLLANYGIPVTRNFLALNAEQAAHFAQEIGFPVAMKVVSPDILHKTEAGGVRLNIGSEADAARAFEEITASVKKHLPKAALDGVLVQEMVKGKYELLIGARQDPIFGPVIVFGMGGVAVEVFKDTNAGLPPLNMALAQRLIEETKIYTLLKGYRGMKGVNIRAIEFLLYKFAYLLMDFPEIREVDINPFVVDEHQGVVLDAKVILDQARLRRPLPRPYAHLVISPYPKEYEKKVRLKDGTPVLLRPVRPEDEPLEAEMFRNFSPETQRYRFFTLIKNITHQLLIRYTQIDYDREIAIIAEVTRERHKQMAGVVRLIADAYNETAEFAIVVADPWQNRGLGNVFTDYILEIARRRGIQKIYANVLEDNVLMLHIFHKRGFRIEKQEDNVCYAELKL